MMHRAPPFIAVMVFLAAARAAFADDRFAGMDAYIREAIQKFEVPGLAIAVVKDGEVVFARGYGVCEVDGDQPVTKDTVFSIASCTKSFTATTIGLLVDEGKVNWDDPVRKHLPNFQVADPYVTENVTLRDLGCHRTGLVRGDLMSVKGDLGPDDILSRTRFLEQATPFRTKFTYHNVMYCVLGDVVKAKSGMPWPDFVARRILEPLDMTSTVVSPSKVPAERHAPRHRMYDGKVLRLQKPDRVDYAAPAGAIHSNVVDMAKWLNWHLQDQKQGTIPLMKVETLRDLHAQHHSIPISRKPGPSVLPTNLVGLGLGWFVREYRGKKVVQHGGAWGADMAIVPEENLGVVVLSNLDHTLLVQMLSFDVIDAYLLGPERAWSKADKWDWWLGLSGPPLNYDKTRREHKAELEKERVPGTKPALPLEKYAGKYESDLYGILEVLHKDGQLSVRFGDHSGDLSHWQDDVFYSPAVVESFLDWLVKFYVADKSVDRLEVVSVGWKDPDEKHIYRRVPSSNDRTNRDTTNSLGMNFALIPAGKFTMGSPPDEKGRDADEVQHEVEITRPFYFGKTEVTVGQFREFARSAGYRTEPERDGEGGSAYSEQNGIWKHEGRKPQYNWTSTGLPRADDHPVSNVSWNDANAFCEWLSRKEGRRYRLPTEAEWEYACRAGTTTRYYHGDNEEGVATVGNVADASGKPKFPAWRSTTAENDGFPFSAPVGKFKPNAFGLYDMHGNVWEWCADWYDAEYYKNSPRQDPQGPENGTHRSARSGCWNEGPRTCRSADRSKAVPSYCSSGVGFRVALVP